MSNVAGVSRQPMPAVGGAQQQGPPVSTSAAREGYGPQSMQQQPPVVRLQGSALRNEVSVLCMHVHGLYHSIGVGKYSAKIVKPPE